MLSGVNEKNHIQKFRNNIYDFTHLISILPLKKLKLQFPSFSVLYFPVNLCLICVFKYIFRTHNKTFNSHFQIAHNLMKTSKLRY